MRWKATRESSDAGEPSIVAILETLCAMAFTVWLAVKWQSITHILVCATLAPLFLARTKQSTAAAFTACVNNQERWRFGLLLLSSLTLGIILFLLFSLPNFWLQKSIFISGLAAYICFSQTTTYTRQRKLFLLYIAIMPFAMLTADYFFGLVILDSIEGFFHALAALLGYVYLVTISILIMFWLARGLGAYSIQEFLESPNIRDTLSTNPTAGKIDIAQGLFPISLFYRIVMTCKYGSFKSVPTNWRSLLLATDFFVSPSLLPLPSLAAVANNESKIIRNISVYDFFSQSEIFARNVSILVRIETVVLTLYVIPFFVLPAFFYRLSIKSTALIWSPLVLAIWPTTKRPEGHARISYYLKRPFFKIALGYSFIVIALFLVKAYVYIAWANLASWYNANAFLQLFSFAIKPTEVPFWQCIAFVNSGILIGIWIYLSKLHNDIEHDIRIDVNKVDKLLTRILAVRGVFSSYTIFCLFCLFLCEATKWHLPPFTFKLFPWP